MKKCLILFNVFIVSLFFFVNSNVEAKNISDLTPFEVSYDSSLEGEEYDITLGTRGFEPNVVHYSVSNNTVEFIYLNNSIYSMVNTNDSYTSYSQNLSGDGDPENTIQLTNDLVVVNDTMVNPYRKIGKITNGSSYGTAFLMGPNIALTCSHCVFNKTTKTFSNNLRIDFGYNGQTYYERVYVTDIYILKLQYDDFTFANDWAICVIDDDLGNDIGYFAKCSGYNLIGLDATIIGYAGGQPTYSQYVSDGEIVKNYPTFKYFAYTVGGMSGSPVFVTINNNTYVAGINSYDCNHYYSGAARISTFLFDFLNYFLSVNTEGAELRDYYYEGITKIRYNTMSELIITPNSDMDVYLSHNNINYTLYTTQEKIFYTSTTSSNYVDNYYKYFKNYTHSTDQYSTTYDFNTYFSVQARTAQYKIVARTYTNDIIATSFDQTSNVWYHNSSSSQMIKGTIAYDGYARNIEVAIPSSGTNLSDVVVINDTSFQLRCGPYRVSLIASQNLICNDNIIFAFGVN